MGLGIIARCFRYSELAAGTPSMGETPMPQTVLSKPKVLLSKPKVLSKPEVVLCKPQGMLSMAV